MVTTTNSATGDIGYAGIGAEAQTFGSDGNLPDHVENERILEPEMIPNEVKAESQLGKLPNPTGWRILIVPYTQPRISKGGIHFSDATINTEEIATSIGYVVRLGPLAYADKAKFNGIPWCKEGDYVVFGRYAGSRLLMRGENNDNLPVRLLNDDEILGVLHNPEDYVGVS